MSAVDFQFSRCSAYNGYDCSVQDGIDGARDYKNVVTRYAMPILYGEIPESVYWLANYQ